MSELHIYTDSDSDSDIVFVKNNKLTFKNIQKHKKNQLKSEYVLQCKTYIKKEINDVRFSNMQEDEVIEAAHQMHLVDLLKNAAINSDNDIDSIYPVSHCKLDKLYKKDFFKKSIIDYLNNANYDDCEGCFVFNKYYTALSCYATVIHRRDVDKILKFPNFINFNIMTTTLDGIIIYDYRC
jgi:hypothetical protein